MFGIHDFGIFLATGILLNLTPGPDSFYVLGRSLAHGRTAGIVPRWEFPPVRSSIPLPLLSGSPRC